MIAQKTPPEAYVAAFANLAALTAPKCAGCRAAFQCCSAAHCEAARDFALDTFGIRLEEGEGPLPFLGVNGCTVPPHLRPICAVHVCESHLADEAFAAVYFEAREAAEDLLMELIADGDEREVSL